MVLNGNTEENKKAFIAMLGKLYISANSKTEKLRSTTKLVIEAIDTNVAQEAASRNALNKLLSALKKALAEAEKVKAISGDTLASSGGNDGLIRIEGERVEDSDDEGVTKVHDSSLEELLNDEDDDS